MRRLILSTLQFLCFIGVFASVGFGAFSGYVGDLASPYLPPFTPVVNAFIGGFLGFFSGVAIFGLIFLWLEVADNLRRLRQIAEVMWLKESFDPMEGMDHTSSPSPSPPAPQDPRGVARQRTDRVPDRPLPGGRQRSR